MSVTVELTFSSEDLQKLLNAAALHKKTPLKLEDLSWERTRELIEELRSTDFVTAIVGGATKTCLHTGWLKSFYPDPPHAVVVNPRITNKTRIMAETVMAEAGVTFPRSRRKWYGSVWVDSHKTTTRVKYSGRYVSDEVLEDLRVRFAEKVGSRRSDVYHIRNEQYVHHTGGLCFKIWK